MTSKNMTGRELWSNRKNSQPVASGSRQSPRSSAAMMSLPVCSVMEMPRITSVCPEGSFCSLCCPQEAEKEISLCSFPSMSELWVSSSPLWLGNHFASLHGHLHLQHGSSQEETQSHKLMESSPTLTGLLEPSLLWTLGSESDFCEMVGCPTVTTLRELLAWQKWQLIKRPVWRVGSREPSKSCPTLNS